MQATFEFGLGGLLSKSTEVSVLDLEAYTFYSSADDLIMRRLATPCDCLAWHCHRLHSFSEIPANMRV